MIQYENVTISRGGRELLREVCFSINAGEKVSLGGPSGCGKSSLMLAMLGAFPIAGGCIRVNGNIVCPDQIDAIRQSIAYIGQEPTLAAETIIDAIMLPFEFQAHKDQRPTMEQIIEILNKLGLSEDLLEKSADVVSGGEKQRVAIARAILLNKRTFLFDEITSALDPESREQVLHLLDEPDYTILSISHDQYWLKHCSRQLTIESGRVVEKNPSKEVGHADD